MSSHAANNQEIEEYRKLIRENIKRDGKGEYDNMSADVKEDYMHGILIACIDGLTQTLGTDLKRLPEGFLRKIFMSACDIQNDKETDGLYGAHWNIYDLDIGGDLMTNTGWNELIKSVNYPHGKRKQWLELCLKHAEVIRQDVLNRCVGLKPESIDDIKSYLDGLEAKIRTVVTVELCKRRREERLKYKQQAEFDKSIKKESTGELVRIRVLIIVGLMLFTLMLYIAATYGREGRGGIDL
jgi:hypothetical protein